MVFSYSTNAFVEYPLHEALNLIAKVGFGGAEIMCDRPHLYPPDTREDDLKSIKELVRKLDLAVTNLNCFTLFAVGDTWLPSWIEPDKKRREQRIEHTLNCLDLARFLECPNISVPPGGPPVGGDREASLALFYKGLEQVIPKAEETGVKILIEPEPGLLIETGKQMKSFMETIASDRIGVNFDAGHFFCVGEAPEEALEDLFEWTGHIHIEDIAASREHNHLIPGLGAMDYKAFFKKLKELGYKGDVCLELYPYTRTPCRAGEESMAHLVPIMEMYGFRR